MMRQTAVWFSFVAVGCLWLAPWIWADIIPDRQIPLYAAQLGVEADMDSVRHDVPGNQTHFAGTVMQPCKLEEMGFCGVKSGERLEIMSLDTGRWKARLFSTGQVQVFDLSIEWAKDD
jgi:hypothetical protein